MSMKKIECFILVCDECGSDFDTGDFTPHFPNEADAIEMLTDSDGGVVKGKHYCSDCYPGPDGLDDEDEAEAAK